jgi:hypothetical protein
VASQVAFTLDLTLMCMKSSVSAKQDKHMKKLTLLVGAVALAGTAPAVAKPDKGHGNGKHA